MSNSLLKWSQLSTTHKYQALKLCDIYFVVKCPEHFLEELILKSQCVDKEHTSTVFFFFTYYLYWSVASLDIPTHVLGTAIPVSPETQGFVEHGDLLKLEQSQDSWSCTAHKRCFMCIMHYMLVTHTHMLFLLIVWSWRIILLCHNMVTASVTKLGMKLCANVFNSASKLIFLFRYLFSGLQNPLLLPFADTSEF